MTSITLPVVGLVVSGVVAVLVLVLAAVAGHCVYQLRRVVPKRLQHMEDALRVYNSANATLGRQLAELEQALAHQRASAAAPPMESAPPRAVQSAAQRYGPARPAAAPAPAPRAGATQVAPGGEFSEAELRLAQLIKSRLSSLRVN